MHRLRQGDVGDARVLLQGGEDFAVGVVDGARTYGHAIVLRAVNSVDAMTAEVVELPYALLKRITLRIIAEVDGVTRVMYDTTPKPPGTIEWE